MRPGTPAVGTAGTRRPCGRRRVARGRAAALGASVRHGAQAGPRGTLPGEAASCAARTSRLPKSVPAFPFKDDTCSYYTTKAQIGRLVTF